MSVVLVGPELTQGPGHVTGRRGASALAVARLHTAQDRGRSPATWGLAQTVMRAVHDHGTQRVEDPTRLEGVAALELDETSFLKATRSRPPDG